jgi:lipopolysaccharide transport system ATP-binding protein
VSAGVSAISVLGLQKRFRVPLDRSRTLKHRVTHLRSASRYRDFYALRDVSFDVREGEFFGVAGPNGCGKSTLLKVIAGIYTPDAGTVQVAGEPSSFLELGVGFSPELTARENIFLGGAVLGLTHKQLASKVEAILHFADLEDFADQKLKNYSSGMQVRLAFTVAILADADIFLMDEVLAVGDAQFQEKCFEVFTRYKREGRTIVLVTHDLNALSNYCDRVILLDHGRVVADGPAADVTATYRRMAGEAIEVGGTDLVGEGSKRWGSREVEMTAVALQDSSGRRRDRFASGDPVSVRIEFAARREVEGLVCLLGIRRADGVLIAAMSTALDGRRIACPPLGAKASIVYSIPSLSLLTGAYTLAAALYDEHSTHPYDHFEDALSFRVIDERGRQGVVDLRGSWQVEESMNDEAAEEARSIVAS